jgi:hypothetical protein
MLVQLSLLTLIQRDQKVSVHLTITVQKPANIPTQLMS